MELPLSTNNVPRAFFPRVAIGCRLSLKIARNYGGDLIGGYMIWFAMNRRYGIWTEYLYRSVVTSIQNWPYTFTADNKCTSSAWQYTFKWLPTPHLKTAITWSGDMMCIVIQTAIVIMHHWQNPTMSQCTPIRGKHEQWMHLFDFHDQLRANIKAMARLKTNQNCRGNTT